MSEYKEVQQQVRPLKEGREKGGSQVPSGVAPWRVRIRSYQITSIGRQDPQVYREAHHL